MNKIELRQIYKAKRQALSEQQVEDMSIEIANQLLQIDIWDKTYYHVFLPIVSQKEVNTEFILHILSGKNKEIVVSKSDFSNLKMTHFLLTDNTTIKINQYNIPEPIDGLEVPADKLEVVFVPLLAFDIKGNRVGYGKGFYDTFLSACKPDAIKIGLSFFDHEMLIEDVFVNDVQLDYCVTPNNAYKF